MDHPFRNAAFGGFNRQDVLTYLENLTRETGEQKQQLQQELDSSRETVSRQEKELAGLHTRLEELEREKAELAGRLAQAENDLSAARGECARLSDRLEQAHGELKRAQDENAALLPDARAYRELKERTAGVELEAHRRAQGIQEKAEQDARRLRRQMEQWMQRVCREFDSLRSEVETTVSHAAAQLERAEQNLEQVTRLMGEQDLALDSLAQTYADTDPERVAAPVPLPEQ